MVAFLAALYSCLITVIFAITREEELAKIGPHEAVTFNLKHLQSDTQLSFDFLGEHYKVQLRRNDNYDHNPSPIKRSGDIDPFNSLTADHDKCHYYGDVLQPHQPGASFLSLSLCPNRGIRGTITIPSKNERLVIFPSRLVHDPQYDRDVGVYNVSDQHMVYQEHFESSHISHTSSKVSGSRDLLSYSWRNKVELYVLVDAVWTYLFKKEYGSRWYNELYSYTKELIDGASAEYEWWNWGNKGTIEIVMVELEIMGEFSGVYSPLKPKFKMANCKGRDWKYNNYQCIPSSMDGVHYIGEFRKWQTGLKKYGDSHLVLTGLDMAMAGWGTSKSICKQISSAIVDAKKGIFKAYSSRIKTIAHELGHNFGMKHSSPQVGVMGTIEIREATDGSFGYLKDKYGDTDVSKLGWVDASVKSLKDYFDTGNGLSCLRNGVRSFKKVDCSSGSGSYCSSGSGSGSSTGSNTGSSGSSSSNDCIEIKYLSGSYNKQYNKVGTNKYKANWQYLFKINGKWTVNSRSTQANSNYLCYKSNILNCGSNSWYIYGEKSSSARAQRCGAFTEDDELDCLKDNEYDDAICLYNNTNELTFVLKTDECYNDSVVYEYDDEASNMSYRLFYNEDYKYIGDEEMSGQWIISEYEIRVIDAIATCDEEDLLQCFEGNWNVRITTNDTLDMIVDPAMSVGNGYCASYARTLGANDGTVAFTIAMVCGGLVLVAVLIAFGWFMYRSKQIKKVEFASDVIAEESEEEGDEEIEMEVETNLTETTR